MSENSSHIYEKLSADQVALVNQFCDQFEQAWREGTTPDIVDHLTSAPESIRKVLLHELVLVDAAYRKRAGTAIDLTSFYRRLPGLDQKWLDEKVPSGESDVRTAVPAEDFSSEARYEVVAEIGRGGMGVVYQARDKRLERPVCLKALHEETRQRPDRLARFRREARVISSLNHPNICTLYELEESEDRPYLVLEWIEGPTFREFCGEENDPATICDLIAQTATALSAAHAAGVVHRDLKPENLMVRGDGVVKILDFGLARLAGLEQLGGSLDGAETAEGAIVGTAKYMSPEQARGETATTASDIFSLGIVLYELITGQHPFPGAFLAAILNAIVESDPTPALSEHPTLHSGLSELISRMLNKQPADRPTAAEVAEALRTICIEANHDQGVAVFIGAEASRPVVGRESELQDLWRSCAQVDAGRGVAVFVGGEPGIGKTTLMESFVDSVVSRKQFILLHGRCSQRLSSSDAYLPVLDALSRCLSGPHRERTAELLKSIAPAWEALTTSSTDALSRVMTDSGQLSQGRLKREFRAFLQALAERHPAVLFIDDLHWADESTLDLLAYLAQELSEMRLLIIGGYRPTDSAVENQQFEQFRRDLVARGRGHEVVLPFLSQKDVALFLERVFPAHTFPETFANLLHERTEGNPLFIDGLVRLLRERDVITHADQKWVVAEDPLALGHDLPSSINNLIDAALSKLSEEDRKLLQTASLQGVEFSAAVVADALQLNRMAVEERLQDIERAHGLIRTAGEEEFKDGTLTLRLSFVHVLYQESLFSALTPARRARLSLDIARVLTELHNQRTQQIALKLAFLYETGRDFAQAIECLLQSARHDVIIGANHEAAESCRRGLRLLRKLLATPERDKSELELQFSLGFAETFSRGYGSEQSREAYNRAEFLCSQQPADEKLFSVLHGLWSYYLVSMDSPRQLNVEARLRKLAGDLKVPAFMFGAQITLALGALHRGQIDETEQHLGLAIDGYEYQTEDDRWLVEQMCPPFGPLYHNVKSWMHQLQGYADQALADTLKAADCAEVLGVPQFEIKFRWHPMLYYLQRKAEQALEWTRRSIELSRDADFDFYEGVAQIIEAWASGLCEEGNRDHRSSLVDQGLSILSERRQRGIRSGTPAHLCMLGEALGVLGRDDEARSTLNESISFGRLTGERWWESESLRQLGKLYERNLGDKVEAEANFREGLELAKIQGVKIVQRRCEADLARLEGI